MFQYKTLHNILYAKKKQMEKHIEKQTLDNDISVNYTLTQLLIFFMTA